MQCKTYSVKWFKKIFATQCLVEIRPNLINVVVTLAGEKHPKIRFPISIEIKCWKYVKHPVFREKQGIVKKSFLSSLQFNSVNKIFVVEMEKN